MTKYSLSNDANDDLIHIHRYGFKKIGVQQADKDFETSLEYFDIITKSPYSFESVEYMKKGYHRCVCGSDGIYYKINNDIVDIMAIVGKQDSKNIP